MRVERANGTVVRNPKDEANPNTNDNSTFGSTLDGLQRVDPPSLKDEEDDPNAWLIEKKKKAHEAGLTKFSNLATMTFEEKVRAEFLEDHHMTEEDLSKLPPDERADVEQQIKDEIKRQMEAQIRQKPDEALDKARNALRT